MEKEATIDGSPLHRGTPWTLHGHLGFLVKLGQDSHLHVVRGLKGNAVGDLERGGPGSDADGGLEGPCGVHLTVLYRE